MFDRGRSVPCAARLKMQYGNRRHVALGSDNHAVVQSWGEDASEMATLGCGRCAPGQGGAVLVHDCQNNVGPQGCQAELIHNAALYCVMGRRDEAQQRIPRLQVQVGQPVAERALGVLVIVYFQRQRDAVCRKPHPVLQPDYPQLTLTAYDQKASLCNRSGKAEHAVGELYVHTYIGAALMHVAHLHASKQRVPLTAAHHSIQELRGALHANVLVGERTRQAVWRGVLRRRAIVLLPLYVACVEGVAGHEGASVKIGAEREAP
mmetsp:Transcript_10951/g.27680  ORF Transcript_10951/g.27680 Transcript_10951/m.27680 type:complete len:263 (+) Transcript_10951:393-1181(+)